MDYELSHQFTIFVKFASHNSATKIIIQHFSDCLQSLLANYGESNHWLGPELKSMKFKWNSKYPWIREKSFRKCIQNMSTIELSWQFEKCNKDEDQKNFLGKDFRILAFAKKITIFYNTSLRLCRAALKVGVKTGWTLNNVSDNYWFSGSHSVDGRKTW